MTINATPASAASIADLGIVTVSYRSEAVLPAFLASVAGASRHPATVVIADNLPHGSAVRDLAHAAGAVHLPIPANPGYGAAVNAGVAALPPTVEWVLISNPDVELGPLSVDRLRDAAEEDTRIGSVGPAVHNADGSLYPSARAIPSIGNGIGHALLVKVVPGNPWTRRYRGQNQNPTEPRDVGWLSGSCLLVRRSAFEQVGGFDESYFMYFEDVDLGYRLGKSGYRNVYEPSAHVTHTGAHSTTDESARMTHTHHESAKRFLQKRYPGPLWWPARAILAAGLTMRSAALTRHSNPERT